MIAEEFSYDEFNNSYASMDTKLTGDCYLRVRLGERGRLAIRKANKPDGPWPIVLMSHYTGPDFEIRIFGQTKGKYIRVETTSPPVEAELISI